jgi:ribosome-binding protein aMBF1 (putative translation factor)
MASHQDWETVVFKSNAKKSTAEVGPVVRKASTTDINAIKIERIDNSDEKLSVKMIDSKVVEIIKKRRCELKLTQKELANKTQIPEAVLKNLEQGKEKHNPPLLTKLQRGLGIKLLGQNIGELLL